MTLLRLCENITANGKALAKTENNSTSVQLLTDAQ